MYELDRFVGEIVTVKLATGVELIAQFAAHDGDSGMVTLYAPRIVVVADDEIAIVPYTFTSSEETVTMRESHILSITGSDSASAAEYVKATQPSEE
jgi:hypothetical protein